MKKALITGITGQDGSFLAEYLIEKNYKVFGLVRRASTDNLIRIKHLLDSEQFELIYGDMLDSDSLLKALLLSEPDEVYNLAGQSDVGISFQIPEYTINVNAIGVMKLLELIKTLGWKEKTKFYQASTSELFGNSKDFPQTEDTPFDPVSPYGIAKEMGYKIATYYRDIEKMFIVNGILFNHESERRGENFVTRKITLAANKIARGEQDVLVLGNLDAKRDWGYAKDYVESMYLMMQQEKPDDYIVATGETHSVREFCELAFREKGIEIEWKKEEKGEIGINKENQKIVIKTSQKYMRKKDVQVLCGNPEKAQKKLGWNPKKTSLLDLIKIMIKEDEKH